MIDGERPAQNCLVCDELSGEIEIPGGVLLRDGAVVGFHAPPIKDSAVPRVYLGHLLVVSQRHVAGLGDLKVGEAAAVGRVCARLARALRTGVGADWVYAAVVGTGVPHFHLHLVARYPDTPRTIPWHAIDEWPGARRGAAPEIAAFVDELRRSLGPSTGN